MKGWEAGLAWFPYKASIIVRRQRQLITKVILTGLFSPFSLASEAHQSSRARMTYIVIKTTPCGHQKTNAKGIPQDRNQRMFTGSAPTRGTRNRTNYPSEAMQLNM
jgi:hypothetical protein